jgi:hypothetical protein
MSYQENFSLFAVKWASTCEAAEAARVTQAQLRRAYYNKELPEAAARKAYNRLEWDMTEVYDWACNRHKVDFEALLDMSIDYVKHGA